MDSTVCYYLIVGIFFYLSQGLITAVEWNAHLRSSNLIHLVVARNGPTSKTVVRYWFNAIAPYLLGAKRSLAL